MTKFVYLAGPIATLTHEEVCKSRHYAAVFLHPWDTLWPDISDNADSHVYVHMTQEGEGRLPEIFRHDMNQVLAADAVLVGYPTGPVISAGTAFECGLAHGAGIPIVVWCPKEKEQVSGFVQQATHMVTDDLYKACYFIREWLA